MAVNENGYLRPTFDDLLESRIEQAKELFGDDIDTSDASALGKFIRLAVQDLADAYEAQEIIYYSRFPHTATGQSLDRLMPFAGITRNPATRAEHEVAFNGTAGYEIPDGFLVGTTREVEFYLVSSVILDESGRGIGIVQCTELGEIGNVALGDITEIINPDADVSEITHTAIITIGNEVESDSALRKRFGLAIEGTGSGTSTAIRGAVMRINGVTGCLIIENNSNETVDSRPPHSFEVFVYAPDILDQEVAEAIFSKKPLGIKTVGDVSVNVVDDSGSTQVINFSRVTETVIYIRATIATDKDFELDGLDQIKSALVGYINSLGNGEDVIFTSLYKHFYSVVGVRDVTFLGICTDGTSYAGQNITMDEDDVARVSEATISIEVTNYEGG